MFALFDVDVFIGQVKWVRSEVKFADRFDKYLEPNFFQHRVGLILSLQSKVTG